MSYISASHWSGTSVILHGVLSFIARVFGRDLGSFSHFLLIRDSSLLPFQLTAYIVDL